MFQASYTNTIGTNIVGDVIARAPGIHVGEIFWREATLSLEREPGAWSLEREPGEGGNMCRVILLLELLLLVACGAKGDDVGFLSGQHLKPGAGDEGTLLADQPSQHRRRVLEQTDNLSDGQLAHGGSGQIFRDKSADAEDHQRGSSGTHQVDGGRADAGGHGTGPAEVPSGTKRGVDASDELQQEADHGHHLHRRHQSPPVYAAQLRRQVLEAELAALSKGDAVESAPALQRSNAMTRTAAERAAGAAVAPSIQQATILEVFVMTTIMASASGLGAVPFFFVGRLSVEWAALANAIACGVMLAASFDLVHEGEPYSAWYTIFGVLLGGMFIKLSQEKLAQWEGVRFEGLQGINAKRALLLVTVMGAHALGEGSGVGVSFCGDRGWAQGVLVTLAIGLHNVPEGLAVATTLVARGVMPRQALFWSVLTSLPQALVAVPAFMFVSTFRALLPLALGFAAGCMVWMVFAELLPDALENASHAKVATAATFSAAWLEALRMGFALLERRDGSLASPFARSLADVAAVVAVLLPAILLASIAGGLMAVKLPPGSLLTGTAAGIMSVSAVCRVVMLWWEGSLGLLWTLVCCGGGSAAALTALRQFATSDDTMDADAKKDDDFQGAAMEANGSATHGAAASSVVNGEAWIPVAGELITQLVPPPANSTASVDRHFNGGVGFHRDVLPSYMQQRTEGASDSSLHHTPRLSLPLPGQPRPDTYAAVAAVAACAVVTDALCAGWRAAAVVAPEGKTSEVFRLWLPFTIHALLNGLAGAALAALVVGPSRRRVIGSAIAFGFVSLAAAALQLSQTPVHGIAATDAASCAALTAKWQAAAAGAMLMLGLLSIMPAAWQMRGGSAATGATLGGMLALVLHFVLAALCLATPYCLRSLEV